MELQGKKFVIDAPSPEAAARQAFLRLSQPGGPPERRSEELLGREPESLTQTVTRVGGRLAKQSALPMAGQIGGAFLGGMAGPLAPIAVPTMEALGGAGGEAMNQALGITEPSLGQIMAAGAAGPAGRAIGYAGRGLLNTAVRGIPGAAVPLNEAAIATARGVPQAIRPMLQSSDEWYQMLERAGNPAFETPGLKDMANQLARQQAKLVNPDSQLVKELDDLGRRHGTMAFDTLRERVKFWARKAEELEGTKSPSEGAYKALYSAGRDALEHQPGLNPIQTQILNEANRVARREYLSDDLTRMIEGSIKTVGDQAQQINVNQVLTKINQYEKLAKLGKPDLVAKRFVESFEPGELEALKKTLTQIGGAAPRIPPGGGAQFGSGRIWLRAALGGGAGYAAGGAGGAQVGGLAAAAIPELLSKALLTDRGRKWAGATLARTATLDQPQLAFLSGLARAFTGSAPEK